MFATSTSKGRGATFLVAALALAVAMWTAAVISPKVVVALPLVAGVGAFLFRRPDIFLYLLVFSLGLHSVTLGPVRPTEVLMPLAFLGALFYWITGRIRMNRTPLDAPVFLLLSAGLLSLFNAEFLSDSLTEWLRYFYTWLLLVMFANCFQNRNILHNAMVAYLLSCLVVVACGAYGYLDLLRGNLQPPFLVLDTFYRMSGTFEDPNYCASFLAVGLFLLLLCGNDLRSKLPGPLIPVLIALIACGILATMSRGGCVAIAVGLLGAWLLKPNWKIIATGAFAVLALSLVPAVFGTDFIGAKFGASSADSADRTRLWEAAFKMIADKPVTGVGIGAFGPLYPRYKVAAEYRTAGMTSHNTLLGLWAETGPLGLFGVAWLYIRFFRKSFLAVRTKTDTPFYRAGAVGLIAGTTLFLQGFTLDMLTSRHMWFVFALGVLPIMRPVAEKGVMDAS